MASLKKQTLASLSTGIPVSRLAHWLRAMSVVYLAVPVVIFLTGWLKLAIAWPVTVLFLVGVVRFARRPEVDPGTDQGNNDGECHVSVFRLCVGIVLATLPVVLCGSGGIGIQVWDWAKHNAILLDLVTQPWPVVYQTDRDAVGLVYYVAYYLPAGLTGKIANWPAANLFLFLTTWIGAILAMLWLVVFARGAAILASGVFVLFSGMDVIGAMTLNPISAWPSFVDAFHLDWWARHWQYSSNISLLYFVPQQALGGWLGAALIIDGFTRGDSRFPTLLLLSMLALWSSFVAIGLLPFVCLYLAWKKPKPFLPDQISIANLAGVVVGTIVVLYFASRFVAYQLPDIYTSPKSGPLPGAFGWIPTRLPMTVLANDYLLFVLCEFAVLAGLTVALLGSTENLRARTLVLCSSGFLLILPFFYYGIYNDLVMRASIPSLFVIQAGVVLAIGYPLKPFLRMVMILVLSIGALFSANLLRMGIQGAYESNGIVHIPIRRHVPSLLQIEMYPDLQFAFTSQYLGSTRSVFYRWLAAELKPYPVETPDNWSGR